jgi:hypothetical protein
MDYGPMSFTYTLALIFYYLLQRFYTLALNYFPRYDK